MRPRILATTALAITLTMSALACTSEEQAPGPTATTTEGEATPMVATLAGVPGQPGFVDGPADRAKFGDPYGLAVATDGTVFVSDHTNNVIRRVDSKGTVTTFAGTGEPGAQDGATNTATFWGPAGLALDIAGNLYVADALNHRIRRVAPDGVVSTVAGGGPGGMGEGGFVDGPALQARFRLPKGIALGHDGAIYVSDTDNHRVRRIADGQVSTYAGTGETGEKDGPRGEATFLSISGIALAPDGTIFVADQPGNSIRVIDVSGLVSHLSIETPLVFPASIAFDDISGILLIADTHGHRVVAVAPPAPASLFVAGSGQQGWKDAGLLNAEFGLPTALAIDPTSDRIVVSDGVNAVLRTIDNWR